MALVVEDGTALSGAESYLSVADLDLYAASHGLDLSGKTTEEKEIALRHGSEYLDGQYGARWTGARRTRTQGLQWPRVGGVDQDGFALAEDEMPTEIRNATAELAVLALAGPLTPDLSAGGNVRSESKRVGPIAKSVEYAGGSPAPPRYRKVEQLVAPLLEYGLGVHQLVRA